jgi:hypothetical protein
MKPRWWLMLGLIALTPAVAVAAPPWSAPVLLGPTFIEIAGGEASVAPLADGDALVAFQDEGDSDAGVFLTTLTPVSEGPRILLDRQGRSPQVVSDPANAATVVWIGTDGLYAVLRGADGELSTPRRILAVAPDRDVRRFDVVAAGRTVGGGLRAVVVAIVDNAALYTQGGRTGNVVALRLDSGAWSAPVTLMNGLQNAVDVDVAATAAGSAAVVWADGGQSIVGQVFAARMTSTGAWRDIARVASRTALDVALSVTETGGSTVAWLQRGPGPDRLLTRTRPPLGRYGDAAQVATGQISQVALGSDAVGNVTMAWVKQTDTQSRLQTAVRPPVGNWSSVGVLAVTSQRIPGVALQVNQRGDAIAGWTMVTDAIVANHFARYRGAGSGFGARERTAPEGDGRNAGLPVLSLANTGEPGAVLQLGASNSQSDVAATLRKTAPIPIVSQLRLSTNRLVGSQVLEMRFRLTRAGNVVVAFRSAARRPAALVLNVKGRAGLNVVSIDGGRVQLPAGRYVVSVGPTAHASDPGVVSRPLQRSRETAAARR